MLGYEPQLNKERCNQEVNSVEVIVLIVLVYGLLMAHSSLF